MGVISTSSCCPRMQVPWRCHMHSKTQYNPRTTGPIITKYYGAFESNILHKDTRVRFERPRAIAVGSPEEQEVEVDGMAKVVLKGGKARLFRGDRRSTVVYPGAIDCVIGRPPPNNGDLVMVCDGKRLPLGVGIINLESVFAVRILESCQNVQHLKELLENQTPDDFVNRMVISRIRVAAQLREMLGFLHADKPSTTAFRLVNAEGDFLPGLIVDIFENIAVVSSSALWIENNREVVETAIRNVMEPTCVEIIWRPATEMLRLEGLDVSVEEDLSDDLPDLHEAKLIKVYEHGASFLVSPYGQKTGFYCDQRDNRRQIRTLSSGKRVLDLCCYSGGFAISAAMGGASSVTGVDSSGPALELARENAAMNGYSDVEFIKDDVSKFLDKVLSDGMSWDIVVLDPPKLAPSRKALSGATRKYVSLNTKAMKVVKPGGLLMTCSCSGAMTQAPGEFSKVIQTAAYRAGVQATIVSKKGAGADHTIDPHYPEGEYLSNYLVRIH